MNQFQAHGERAAEAGKTLARLAEAIEWVENVERGPAEEMIAKLNELGALLTVARAQITAVHRDIEASAEWAEVVRVTFGMDAEEFMRSQWAKFEMHEKRWIAVFEAAKRARPSGKA